MSWTQLWLTRVPSGMSVRVDEVTAFAPPDDEDPSSAKTTMRPPKTEATDQPRVNLADQRLDDRLLSARVRKSETSSKVRTVSSRWSARTRPITTRDAKGPREADVESDWSVQGRPAGRSEPVATPSPSSRWCPSTAYRPPSRSKHTVPASETAGPREHRLPQGRARPGWSGCSGRGHTLVGASRQRQATTVAQGSADGPPATGHRGPRARQQMHDRARCSSVAMTTSARGA